jgi:ribonuclease HII
VTRDEWDVAGGPAYGRVPALEYGIDEAGRGAWLGPMALALVGIDAPAATRLTALGVTDSKVFGSGAKGCRRRAELAAQIEAAVPVARVVLCPAAVVDAYTWARGLDELERRVAVDLLRAAQVEREAVIVADGARLFGPLSQHYAQLRALDRADAAHVAVAAASILAKHARDVAFTAGCIVDDTGHAPDELLTLADASLRDAGAPAGAGYVNHATRARLASYRADHAGADSPQLRRSWGAREAGSERAAAGPGASALGDMPAGAAGPGATPSHRGR